MSDKYKETSQGGLAVNLPECRARYQNMHQPDGVLFAVPLPKKHYYPFG
jgi:hypothetical protein